MVRLPTAHTSDKLQTNLQCIQIRYTIGKWRDDQTVQTLKTCTLQGKPKTSVMIIITGPNLRKQHTDLLICHYTKQDLSRTSRYLSIT